MTGGADIAAPDPGQPQLTLPTAAPPPAPVVYHLQDRAHCRTSGFRHPTTTANLAWRGPSPPTGWADPSAPRARLSS